MGKRYTYLRSAPHLWAVIDTAKTPATCVCMVPESNAEANESADAARICDVMNRDHEMAEQIAEATRRRETGS